MAFEIENWGRISGSKSKLISTIYGYTSTTDDLATIVASAYFNDLIALNTAIVIQVGDVILITGTDGTGFRKITSITTNVTVAAVD